MNHRIGIIGLGSMGAAFARRHLAAGITPVVANRTRAVAERLGAEGAYVAESFGEVAERCDVILSVLSDEASVRAVYEGDHGLLATARPGTLLIECSTVAPSVPASLAALARDRGLRFAEAGVGAMPRDALAGTVNFMVGCLLEDEADVRVALAPLTATLTRCGDPGAGMTMKVINNLLANAIHVADIEALRLAEAAGLDRDLVMSVLLRTAAGNNYLRDRVPGELADNVYAPGFRVDHGAKDNRLGRELADKLGVPVRVLREGGYLLTAAQAAGVGDRSLGIMHRVLAGPPARCRPCRPPPSEQQRFGGRRAPRQVPHDAPTAQGPTRPPRLPSAARMVATRRVGRPAKSPDGHDAEGGQLDGELLDERREGEPRCGLLCEVLRPLGSRPPPCR